MPKLKRIKTRIMREAWLRKMREQFPRTPKVRRGYWWCRRCQKVKRRRDFEMYPSSKPHSTCKRCEGSI